MKKIKTFSVCVLFFCVSQTLFAQEHKHHHESNASEAKSQSNQKFIADSNLQSKMQRVSALLDDLDSPVKTDKKRSPKEVGVAIEKTVREIFETCKLEPSADATIHPILAQILSGADHFKNGKSKEGLELIHVALQKYQEKFTPSTAKSK